MNNKKTKILIGIKAARCTLYAVLLLALVQGCESNGKPNILDEQIQILREESKQLTHQLELAKNGTKQLKKQLHLLTGLPEDKFENLYSLQKIKITRYTNLYDKDKDGKREKLIVYIQPIDEDDDIVKATGAVDVQLWDLNKKSDKAMVGQWHVAPTELKKLWLASLISINYRLIFDVAEEVIDSEEDLTVKVTFTDYLTGKVFKEQKTIKPQQ